MTQLRLPQTILLLFLVQACTTVSEHNPFESAETPAQTAYAAIGVATVYLDVAAEVIKDPDLSKGAVTSLLVASEGVHTALTGTTQTLRTYLVVKEAPDTTEAKVNEALGALVASVEQLRPAISGLIVAIDRAQE